MSAESLVEWLRARLDEDAQDDRAEIDTFVKHYGPAQLVIELEGAPRGVLARAKRGLDEVAAKRRILDEHPCGEPVDEPWCWSKVPWCERCSDADDGPTDYPCLTVRLLALPYADRPGYRDEWTPE